MVTMKKNLHKVNQDLAGLQIGEQQMLDLTIDELPTALEVHQVHGQNIFLESQHKLRKISSIKMIITFFTIISSKAETHRQIAM